MIVHVGQLPTAMTPGALAAERVTAGGWGLVTMGVAFAGLGLLMIPIVRARNADGTSKYIPERSRAFKFTFTLFFVLVGVIMVVAGLVDAL